jgi:hypothetical protein
VGKVEAGHGLAPRNRSLHFKNSDHKRSRGSEECSVASRRDLCSHCYLIAGENYSVHTRECDVPGP